MTISEHSSGPGSKAPLPSIKPYLLRAIYQWSVDCGCTPQILVDTRTDEVVVPAQYVQDNRIVLNIHPQSVKDMEMGNEYVVFTARFGGKPFDLTVPVASVIAIYSRENGQGIVFQEEEGIISLPDGEEEGESTGPTGKSPKTSDSKGSTHLKLIK